MNRILCILLVFTFITSFSSAYFSEVLWAHSEGNNHSSHGSGGNADQTNPEVKGKKAEAVADPVCGMIVSDIKKAPFEGYKGKVYYFCSENCKKAFKKSPKSYIEGLLKR